MSELAGRGNLQWTLHGVKDLERKLTAMGKGKKLSSVLRSAVRAGMNPVRAAAASALVASPASGFKYHRTYHGHMSYKGNWLLPGFAKRHVKIETFISRDKQAAKAIVGPVKEAFYASQWVELGMQSKGYPANPWLRPALHSNAGRALDAVSKAIARRLVQLAKQKAPA